MALLCSTKFDRFGEVKGFDRVGCVGRSVDAVSGARMSAHVSYSLSLMCGRARTLKSDVGIWVLVSRRADSILYPVVVIAIDAVAVFVY